MGNFNMTIEKFAKKVQQSLDVIRASQTSDRTYFETEAPPEEVRSFIDENRGKLTSMMRKASTLSTIQKHAYFANRKLCVGIH